MKDQVKFSLAIILILIVLFPLAIPGNGITIGENAEEKPIVLIDNSHGQFINSTYLTKAISSLEALGYLVIVTKDSDVIDINLLTGNGIDLLILPNPSAEKKYAEIEKLAIGQFMLLGQKGLIMLTNPNSDVNESISGNPSEFNLLLSTGYISLADERFSVNANNNKGVKILKVTEDNSDPSLLTLNFSKRELDIFETPDEFWTIKTQASAVSGANTILNAGSNAFIERPNKNYGLQNSDPAIIAIITMINKSRLVIAGSSLMFSDLPHPEDSNSAWFDMADNSKLWTALVKWTLTVDQSLDPLPPPELTLLYLITGITAIFIITGVIIHRLGKEIQILEIDQDKLRSLRRDRKKSTEDEEESVAEQLSRSQKRLRQRQQTKKSSSRRK